MPPERTNEMEPAADAPSLQAEAAASDFLEFEGSTVFAASPAPTYRYSLTLKNGKLRIWLEDCDSKEQWCTNELGLGDYVTLSNSIIPGASASDYAECFNELLEDASANVDNICSSFKRIQDDVFQLEMAVKTQVLKRARVAKFSFTLEPISVERIDVLESKMRDLQEEMKTLRNGAISDEKGSVSKLHQEVKKLRVDLDGRDKLIAQLQSEVKTVRSVHDAATEVIHAQGTRVHGDGVVKGLKRGVYLVTVVVNYFGGDIRLMRGGECVQAAASVYSSNSPISSTLSCMIRVDERDGLVVQCNQNLTKVSYLTLIRIGN